MTVALAWSGGKDSALALMALRAAGVEPVALLTTVVEGAGRVTVHGVRGELLERQAAATGIPLARVAIPSPCPDELYAERMRRALADPPLADVEAIAFGDLFLQDVRAYRERRLAEAAPPRRALFPLWGRETAELAQAFLAAGFHATLVSVDTRALPRTFAGRAYDARLLAELPPHVDPCGERGEFHTFVHGGPIFDAPIAIARGETVERDGFLHTDLLAPDDRSRGG